MRISLNGTLAQAVINYTGKEVLYGECVADPQTAGAFALMAQVLSRPEGRPVVDEVHFLITGVPLQSVKADDLQECEFTEWPPTSR